MDVFLRVPCDRLLVGRIIMVSCEIFFIFMIMNKKKTANIAQISRKSEVCGNFKWGGFEIIFEV